MIYVIQANPSEKHEIPQVIHGMTFESLLS